MGTVSVVVVQGQHEHGGSGRSGEHLLIVSQQGELVYEKDYGRKAPYAECSRCVAEHFGSTWDVELVRTR